MDDSIGLEKHCCLLIQDVLLTATASSADLELIAIVVRNGDLVLCGLSNGDVGPVVRWIPWFDDVEKKLCAIACNPNGGEGLLLACYDQSFYMMPSIGLLAVADADFNPHSHDVLKLPHPFLGNDGFVPSAIAWWVRHAAGDSTRHSAIVGATNGQVVAFTIYTGTVLFTTTVEGFVSRIEIFTKPDVSYVVVTSSVGKQWRIMLSESQRQVGSKSSENSLEKKFSSLNINVVEGKPDIKTKKAKTLSSPLKVDVVAEERIFCKKDVKLDVTMHSLGEQMLHVNVNVIVSSYNGSLVTLESNNKDQVSVHKLPEKTIFFGTTNSFFILGSNELDRIFVISRNLSICKTDSARHLLNTDFNSDALIQEMKLEENERLIEVYSSSCRDHGFIITTLGIYVVRVRKDPYEFALNAILANVNLHEAEKMSIIFGLDLHRLICQAAGIKLSEGRLEEAKHLYSLAPNASSVHQVTMLAITGHFPQLIDALQNYKSTTVNRTPITNLKILLFVHEMLLHSEDFELAMAFRDIVVTEEFDEVVAMRVLSQVQMFTELHFLVFVKNLHLSVFPTIMALAPTLDMDQVKGFWELMSDPILTETLISRQAYATFHATFVQKYIEALPLHILKSLEKLYNPYQTTVRNFISQICQGELPTKLWVETYLKICICMSSILDEFDENSLYMTSYGHVWEVEQPGLPYVPQILSAGYGHACLVLKGIAYGWGWSSFGCLGFGPTNQPVGGPKAVDALMNLKKTVIAISCGRHHTIALTNDGVYTWGINSYGQLGIGNVVQAWHPTRIEILSSFRVISVCAGQYHSMALDDSNRVFSWGWGTHGQLGHGSIEDMYRPKIITFLSDKGVCSFSAGQSHSVFLDAEGRVWACGNNTFGQLGTGEMKKSTTPLQIYALQQRIIFISAGYFQNAAISADGKVYQWGRSPTVLRLAAHSAKRRGRTEQLPVFDDGRENAAYMCEESAEHMIPKLVDLSPIEGRIVKVCVGAEHAVALTENGTVYSWGRNADGQLGILATLAERRTQNLVVPVPVTIDAKIVNVACGFNSTIALDDEGQVWTWGAIHHVKGTRGSKLAGLEGEIVVVNNKNRVIKFPNSNNNVHPVPTVLNINHQNKEQEMFYPAKLPSPLINSQWRTRMHFALEQLTNYYDARNIMQQCLLIKEHCACSKLALLAGDYATSVIEKLLCTESNEEKIAVLNHYFSLDFSDSDSLRKMLLTIIHFWNDNKLNFESLEDVFVKHETKIFQPLGILLFGTNSSGNDCSTYFTTTFKVTLVKGMIALRSDNFECVLDGFYTPEDVIKALENVDEFIDIDRIQIRDPSSTNSKERRFFST